MEMSESKRRILEASLNLFSQYGYESTSMNQIADAVGIRKASIYSHFGSKQEIFECLLEELTQHYEQGPHLSETEWNKPDIYHTHFLKMTPEQFAQDVVKQIRFLAHDPIIRKTRRMLCIEQFQNAPISVMQEKRAYQDIQDYHIGLIKYLMKEGVFEKGDPEILALQCMAPISIQLYRIDRNPDIENQALELIEKHVIQFFEKNMIKK